MKRNQTTTILLGIIAAEVAFLTARAIADRRRAAAGSFNPDRREPDEVPGESRLASGWRRLTDSLRRWFSGAAPAIMEAREDFRREWRERAEHPGMGGYNDHGQYEEEEEAHARQESNGARPRTVAPWAREAAADATPEADAARAQAERAVPMPHSAHYTQRLDRNQYIGNGMTSRGRQHP